MTRQKGVGAALAVVGVGYTLMFLIGRPFLLPLATPWPLRTCRPRRRTLRRRPPPA